MFPGVYGFSWSPGHLIFLGLFFAVGMVIVGTLTLAVTRAARDLGSRRVEAIAWTSDFNDLPQRSRRCRHELTGETRSRACDRGFDCRGCAGHAEFEAKRIQAGTRQSGAGVRSTVYGYEMPADRLYHRGHTWVRPEADGTLLVGLDDYAARLLGAPDEVELPNPGQHLVTNGTAVRVRRGRSRVRILAPINGEVMEARGEGSYWFLKIRPESAEADLRHLLRPHEIGPWLLREIDRLRLSMAEGSVGASLADGGLPVANLSEAFPTADWDAIWSETFLQP
jgi:glycine cleavage system H lipoate-binding protein